MIDSRLRPSRSLTFSLTALLLGSCLGCTSDLASQLEGVWVGRPDTAAARRERETETFGSVATTENSDGGASEVKPQGKRPQTDWEQYDVTVRLRFLEDSQLELQMDGQPNKVVAEWSVVEETPASLVLQLKTAAPPQATAQDGGAGKQTAEPVLRRFELLPKLEEGMLVGFSWREVDAERQVGSLYFTRAEK